MQDKSQNFEDMNIQISSILDELNNVNVFKIKSQLEQIRIL